MKNKEKPGPIRKLLQTAGRGREVADVPVKPSAGFIQSSGGAQLTDAQYVSQFASPDELSGLRLIIEERRKSRPQFTYWLCPRCSWKAKLGPEPRQPLPCLRCNLGQFKDSGWLQPMSEKEAKQFETDTAAAEAKAVERRKKSHFNEVNENRRRGGLAEQSWEEFLEDSKRAAKQIFERSQGR